MRCFNHFINHLNPDIDINVNFLITEVHLMNIIKIDHALTLHYNTSQGKKKTNIKNSSFEITKKKSREKGCTTWLYS